MIFKKLDGTIKRLHMVTYVYIMASQNMYIKLATYEQLDLYYSYVFLCLWKNNFNAQLGFMKIIGAFSKVMEKCDIY